MIRIMSMWCGASGDSTLGNQTKFPGATIASNTVTLDPSNASGHAFRPRNGDASVGPWSGAWLADSYQFVLANGTGTIGSPHYLMRVATSGADGYVSIRRTTTGNWEFIVNSVTIYTQIPTGPHHIHWIFANANKTSGGSMNAGAPTMHVALYIDKQLVYQSTATWSGTDINMAFTPTYGGVFVAGTTMNFTVQHFVWLQEEWGAPIGKLTVVEWPLHTGQTPYASYDEAVKSAGADAAALVDERPPAGASGSTVDVDWYEIQNVIGGAFDNQTSDLTDNILPAGATFYGILSRHWTRSRDSSKVINSKALLHDGTNVAQINCFSLSGVTGYQEQSASGSAVFSHKLAPDGAEWPTKSNTYLNALEVGQGFASGGNTLIDCILVEICYVMPGDNNVIGVAVLPNQIPGSKQPVPRPEYDHLADLRIGDVSQVLNRVKEVQRSIEQTARQQLYRINRRHHDFEVPAGYQGRSAAPRRTRPGRSRSSSACWHGLPRSAHGGYLRCRAAGRLPRLEQNPSAAGDAPGVRRFALA